jgi:hypothetical protein
MGVRSVMCGPWFLCRLRMPVRPFPGCAALPSPRTMRGSDALTVLGPPVEVASRGCAPQEPSGPPTCLTLLSTPTTRFVAPGRPSGSLPTRFLCLGCWRVKTIAVCMSRDHGAVSRVGACGPACGRRGALWTLHRARSVFTSSTGATLGRSGWLDRTPQGRAPCQKRHASLGALTPPAAAARRLCAASAAAGGWASLL